MARAVGQPDTSDKDVEAPFGALDPEAYFDVVLLREFEQNRQRHFAKLFGRRLKRSPLRDELIRLIIITFGQSRHQRAAYYVKQCLSLAAEPLIRHEIDNLMFAGLVHLRSDPAHSRAKFVVPTNRLIDFYNEQLPRLRSEAEQLLRRRALGPVSEGKPASRPANRRKAPLTPPLNDA